MINNNENPKDDDNDDDELGIELPDLNQSDKDSIVSVLEDTFLVRLSSMSELGENAIDLKAVEKFVKRFPKHKDKVDKLLAKSKANKLKQKKDI